MPTKEELEEENKSLKDLLNKTANLLSTNIMKLFNDIQNDRPTKEIIKEQIKYNPFVTKSIPKSENKKSSKTSKWEFYNKIIHYAADESTPLKCRTLDYLCKKIPFSRKAISRQVYRLGYKWYNRKVTRA